MSRLPPPFLRLNAVGISVPQGVKITARVARESASGSWQSAVPQPGAPQGAQSEVPRGGSAQGCSMCAAGSSATEQVNLGASTSGVSPRKKAFRAVSFVDVVQEFADDDVMSSASDKGAGSEGHRNVLHLLYQLCPAAAPESPPSPRRVCDFEGLFAFVDRSSVVEGVPTLFRRVSELQVEHRQHFLVAAETGKPPSSALLTLRGVVIELRAQILCLRLLLLLTQGFLGLWARYSTSSRFPFILTRLRGWNPCVRDC